MEEEKVKTKIRWLLVTLNTNNDTSKLVCKDEKSGGLNELLTKRQKSVKSLKSNPRADWKY